MASIKTPKGRLRYKPAEPFFGIKRIDRNKAFENLKILMMVMNKAEIRISPAYGTLLGIIRDGNFIEWDEDIDMFVLIEEKDKFLNSLWDLKEEGFELIRVDRCGHVYSIIRNGEYIDFYIMEPLSPEVRFAYGGTFLFERYLTDLIDYDFRGLTLKIPRDYEECLEFVFGDWRTPVQWVDFERSKMYVIKYKLRNSLKKLIPEKIRLQMMKKYHRKYFDKFLAKCKEKGVELKYGINY